METPTLTPPERLTGIFEWLMKDVAAEVVWDWLPIPLIKLYWRRLRNLKWRFASIMARHRAGTLAVRALVVRESAPRPAAEARPVVAPQPPALALPTRAGWLMTIGQTVIPGYELEKMVADPALAALVGEVPELGRVLRPLCHMLAVRLPAWLRLPRKPRPSRAVRHPPAPEFMMKDPAAIHRPDGTVWMRFGASTMWRPGCGRSLEEELKYDRPQRIWPRRE